MAGQAGMVYKAGSWKPTQTVASDTTLIKQNEGIKRKQEKLREELRKIPTLWFQRTAEQDQENDRLIKMIGTLETERQGIMREISRRSITARWSRYTGR